MNCPHDMRLSLYSDAAYEEKEHTAGLAAVLFNGNVPVYAIGKKVSAADNTEAEMSAIYYALTNIPQDGQKIKLHTDSYTAVSILRDGLIVAPYMQKAEKINQLIKERCLDVKYNWVPREENAHADAVSKVAARYGFAWAKQ